MTPVAWTPETTLDAPGVWTGVPEQVYHALPWCSSSRLGDMHDRSAYAVRWALDNPPAPSIPASNLRLGTAMHIALLEREDFFQRVASVPDFRSKERKALALDLLAEGKVALTHSEYDLALAVQRGDGQPQEVRAALSMLDYTELTILREVEGVLCKHRLDGYSASGNYVLDVKTGRVDEESCAKKLYEYGYDRQAALYSTAAAWAFGVVPDGYLMVTVTQQAPVEAAVYVVPPHVLETGSERALKVLERWAECERTGEWPYRMTEVRKLDYPAWATRKIEEELSG